MSGRAARLIPMALAAALLAVGCGSASSVSQGQSGAQSQSSPKPPAVVQAGEHWFKVPDALDDDSVDGFAQKMRELEEKYLTEENRVFYAVIPDKTEFAPPEVPRLESAPMLKRLEGQMGQAQPIDLTGTLALEDYFLADGHWKQESLQPVLDALGKAMGFEVSLEEFETVELEGFRGGYEKDLPQGQSLPQETLTLLTSPAVEGATVKHFQDEYTQVYDTRKDAVTYDLFLSGVDPILTITSPKARTDRSLVIFRDSFGSSITPLLVQDYKTVTLVDTRYIASELLGEYLDFHGQDVLFLYNTLMINSSASLK